MVLCIMIRKNKTIKYKRINDKYDSFEFEGGRYYIRKDKILLKHKPLSRTYISTLIYIEGISEPLSLKNIEKKAEYDKDGNLIKDDETILIDAKSIHNITSEKILSVLSSEKMSTKDKFILISVWFAIILIIASMTI